MDNVKAVLREQGRSVAWLAQRLGVSRVSLYRWFNGTEPWPAGRKEQACELLGISEEELFPVEDKA